MASKIQIKRGTGSAVPSGLADGELAINLDNGQLYFGSGSTSVNSFRFTNLTADNYIVSSSVTNMIIQTLSGSTQFGDSTDDIHLFTGNITASGYISASGDLFATNLDLPNDGKILLGDNNNLRIDYDSSGYGYIQNTAGNLFITNTADNKDIIFQGNGGNENYIKLDGGDLSVRLLQNVTASGNISASGDIIGSNLTNVENTAISTFAGTSNITTVGTIGTGTWNGSVIASAKLDADTAHLTTNQTFTGAKTFNTNPILNGTTKLIADDMEAIHNDGSQLVISQDNRITKLRGTSFNVDTNITASGNISSSGTITTTGVGIGTTTPSAPLEVSGRISQIGLGLSTFIGFEAGLNDDLSDNANTFIGDSSGRNTTTGNSNLAIGYRALTKNTTGNGNIAKGARALENNLTSNYNVAIGASSLRLNTAGSYNVGIGFESLYNTTSGFNIAVGYRAIKANTSGQFNIAFGFESLDHNTTGDNNIVLGRNAFSRNTTGNGNIVLGYFAGYHESDGSTYNSSSNNSILLGDSTKPNASNQTNQVVIGHSAVGVGSNTVVLGNDSIITTALKGKVGIGTTTPTSLLEISSTSETDFLKLTSAGGGATPIKLIFEKSAAEQGVIEYNRNGDLEIYNTDNDGGVLIDGSTSAGGDFYVSNTGNVGIGTTTPGAKLHVAGIISASSVVASGNISASGIITGTGFTAGNAVITEAELELLDGLTAGTAIASKVVTTDANIDTTGQRNLTISGELDAATGDFSGNVDIAGDLTGLDNITSTNFVIGGHTINDVDVAGEFVDSAEHLLTSAAALDKFAVINADTTGTATNSTHVLVSDNESTNEENELIFVEDAAAGGAQRGIESSAKATFNPSNGKITATGFVGALTGDVTGQADTVATIAGLAPNTATTQAAQGNITSLGTLTTLTVDNVIINGSTIGHTDDTDLLTVADGILTVAGEISVTTLDIGGTNITSTAAEINALDGITAVVGELNALDIGSTAVGTAVASKAVILDSNKDYTGIRNLTVSGELDAATGDFSGAVDIAGDLTLSAGADGALTFGAASSIKIVDNQASSLVIEQADVAYMTFKTTNSSEIVEIHKPFNASGISQFDGEVTVGVDGTGHDVIFYGANSGRHLQWDESANQLLLAGASLNINTDGLLQLAGTAVTSTAAELNALDGITAVVGELNALDLGSTAVGTAIASKAVILDSNKDYTGIRNLTVSGELDAATGDFSGAVDIAGDLTLSAGADGALTFGAASSIKIVDNQASSLVIEEANNAYLTFVTTNSSEAITLHKSTTISAPLTVGVDDTGHDVKLFGATSGKSLLWDESADSLIVTGTTTLVGTTNLDVVDIDGNVQLDGTLTVGVNDTGYDVTLFGATANRKVVWDASQDFLKFYDNTKLVLGTGAAANQFDASIVFNATDLVIDSPTDIQIDAAGGNVEFLDDGTLQLTLDMDGTAGAQVITLGVDNDNLIFKAHGGGTILTLDDDTSVTAAAAFTAGGIITGTGFTAGNAVIAEAELELLDGLTAGTAIASKVVTTDANIDTTGQRNLTITGELDAATGDFSGAVDIAGDLTLSAGADGALTFGAASSIKIVDNQASSLVIEEANTAYMTFTTTNSSELITANKGFNAAGTFQIGGTAVTSTAAELNLLDDAAANSVVNSKAVIYGSSGELAGVLSTVAQTNVTSVGTLSALTVSGDINANGNIVGDDSTNITNISSIECDSLVHDGDTDTKLTFGADSIRLTAGGTIATTLTTTLIDNNLPSKNVFTPSGDTAGNIGGGDVVFFGGTTSMTTGAIYHYKSDGTWELADATDNTKADGLLGVALGAASDNNGVLLRGMVTLDHDAGAIGDPIYLTATAGDASATPPGSSGNVVRHLGYKIFHASQGQIWFNPSNDWIEIA